LTRVEGGLVGPLPDGLELRWKGFPDRKVGTFVSTGDAQFDENFAVSGPEQSVQWLLSPEVRRALLYLHGTTTGSTVFRGGETAVRCSESGILDDSRVGVLVEAMTGVAAAFGPRSQRNFRRS